MNKLEKCLAIGGINLGLGLACVGLYYGNPETINLGKDLIATNCLYGICKIITATKEEGK